MLSISLGKNPQVDVETLPIEEVMPNPTTRPSGDVLQDGSFGLICRCACLSGRGRYSLDDRESHCCCLRPHRAEIKEYDVQIESNKFALDALTMRVEDCEKVQGAIDFVTALKAYIV
uniref:Uncharacterized protein n=1 Tax=Solanum tuberosum TaxID=4113 RepID=M1DBE4_SOLTU